MTYITIGNKPIQRQWPALPARALPAAAATASRQQGLPKAHAASTTANNAPSKPCILCVHGYAHKASAMRSGAFYKVEQTLSTGAVVPPPPRTGGAPAAAPVLALGWGAVMPPPLLRGAVVTPLPPAVARASAALPVLLLPPIGGLAPAALPLPLHAQAVAR